MKRRLVLAAVVAGLLSGPAQAAFPEREIRFICGFPPGGTCDLLSRLLAEHLSPIFGQRVIVENRTGASGMIAADYVARRRLTGTRWGWRSWRCMRCSR
jgi:tripartite-type tricarboxylate transporter receptor subunit TctC